MRAAEVRSRLRVVRATMPASRKFQGTILSARLSRRASEAAFRRSDCSTRLTMDRSLVLSVTARTRT